MSETASCTIENELVRAVISAQAAEVISFLKKADDIETIWCRDPAYWFNCNPILFPYTGPLIDGKYQYQGKTYELGQHGFARRARFTIEEAGKDHARLSLTYSEKTLAVYPFRFKLVVDYTLEGTKLHLDYQVVNLDDQELPFSIGFHPAFNCPLTTDKQYSDYRIEFDSVQDLSGEKDLGKVQSFPLAGNLEQGSFFYHDHQITSQWALLTDGTHGVKVGCGGFRTLGFWKKTPDTPFICIEPWFPDSALRKAPFFRPDKDNEWLPVGETYRCGYWFQII